MVRFLADADLNYAIVEGCRRHEPALDFLSANEARLHGVPDPEVLALAAAEGRIPVTSDLKTMPRHFGEFPDEATVQSGPVSGKPVRTDWGGH